jgi:Carboxypeptidase regulatory-like domain
MLPVTFLTATGGIRVRALAKLKVGAVAAAGLAAAVMAAPATSAVAATTTAAATATATAAPHSAAHLTVRAGAPRPAGAPAMPPTPLTARLRSAAVQRLSADGVTGTVRGLRGVPLTGACVTAHGPSGTRSTTAARDGRYLISGLRPGLYTLEYRDCAAPGRYFPQWSGGTALARSARQVSVTGSQLLTLAPVTLRPTSPAALLSIATPAWLSNGASADSLAASVRHGRISGLVTDRARHPLKGICVYTVPQSSGVFYRVRTSKAGTYLSKPLKPGKYLVAFLPGCGNKGNWLLQFYKNTSNGGKATPVKVTAGKTTPNINARLRLGGEIKGTVTSKSGAKLSGICVDLTDRHGNQLGGAITHHGSYQLTSVKPGRYGVLFTTGCNNTGNYAPQFWKDKPLSAAPTLIHVVSGKVVSRINAVLAPGGEISGTVTTSSKTPLPGICVDVSGEGADSGIAVEVATNASGKYLVNSLATGSYQVNFYPGCNSNGNYLPATFPGSVHVTAGQVTAGINQVLQPGAAVKGTVTSKASGKPVPGICVQVYGDQGADQVYTGPNGSYYADQLPTGQYTVAFAGGCGSAGSYAPQYYDGQANDLGAAVLNLIQGKTQSGIDAALLPGGTVTGSVTSKTGQRLSNICVTVFTPADLDIFGPGFGEGFAQSFRGKYEIANLSPGQYETDFTYCGHSGAGFAGQSFRARPGLGSGQLISVDPGSITSGISAVMQPGGLISGTVTSKASRRRLTNICVTATYLRNGSVTQADNLVTFDGKYSISGLAAGAYSVEFSPCGLANYANAWYRNKSKASAATRVIVRAGRSTAHIDAVMTAGGTISGHVSDATTKAPVRNVCVYAYSPATSDVFGLAITGAQGNYVVKDLNTGSYQVEYFPCYPGGKNYAAQFRHGLIHVTAGRAVSGSNAALTVGGSVSGTVTSTSPPAAQSGICVDVVPTVAGQDGSIAVTGAGGTYVAGNLAPGTYKVYFGDPACSFGPSSVAPQWYSNRPSQATATPVTVTAGHTATGINAALASDGQISGMVTGPAHAKLTGACAAAVRLGAGSVPVIAVTRSGRYSIIDLTPGRYRVEFSSGCGASGYATQWWKNASSKGKATIITVPPNAVRTGIDAVLKR